MGAARDEDETGTGTRARPRLPAPAAGGPRRCPPPPSRARAVAQAAGVAAVARRCHRAAWWMAQAWDVDGTRRDWSDRAAGGRRRGAGRGQVRGAPVRGGGWMQAVAASRGLDAGGGGLVGAVPHASTGWADGGGGRWPARVVDGVPAGVAGRAVEDLRRRTGGRWAWEEAGVGLGVPRVSSWAGLNLGPNLLWVRIILPTDSLT